MPDNDSALIVFAKIPEPNKVKTRLTTLLSPEEASQLYASFLLDALDEYMQLPVDVRLYYAPVHSQIPDRFVPQGVSVFYQKGEGLGARMAAAFAESFVKGYQRIVIVGTDHPTLPPAFLHQAYSQLETPYTITIGPSEDGGYYLLGMNEFYPQLFEGMAYSHEDVFKETVHRAGQLPAELSVLPEWYDVDTPDLLNRLVMDVNQSDLSLIRTRETLHMLAEQYPSLRV